MSSKKKELSFSLSDLNILILGAKLGIGASLARICAEQNANVILVDKEEPIELADNLRQLAVANIVTYGCDISNRDAVESLAAELSQKNYSPHSVALTAGITFYNDWLETDNETWDRDVEQIFNVNLAGPINVARSFLPIMEKNNWGRMV